MDEIQKLIRGEVDRSEATLDAHSRDASIFEVKPDLVVYPKNANDLRELVRYATVKKHEGVEVSLCLAAHSPRAFP
jgi:FAD/FMN-containing dehydrogenase